MIRIFGIVSMLAVACATANVQAQSTRASGSVSTTQMRIIWHPHATANCIKTDATGCSMSIEVVGDPCIQPIVSVSSSTTVSYTESGRNDQTTSSESWSGSACRVFISETMDGKVVGGNVFTNVVARISTGETSSGQKAETFLGNNPANDDVRKYLANPTYAVVVYDRSRFKQFASDGKPNVGKGFGVMQIAPADAEQPWHWKRNVDAGRAGLDAAWAAAKAYPAKMRANGYPKIPDFSAKELKLFALQSLVGEQYYVPNTNGRQWIPNNKRSDYADRLAKIEADVVAGKPPADW
jgi:hypothetical protein